MLLMTDIRSTVPLFEGNACSVKAHFFLPTV